MLGSLLKTSVNDIQKRVKKMQETPAETPAE